MHNSDYRPIKEITTIFNILGVKFSERGTHRKAETLVALGSLMLQIRQARYRYRSARLGGLAITTFTAASLAGEAHQGQDG